MKKLKNWNTLVIGGIFNFIIVLITDLLFLVLDLPTISFWTIIPALVTYFGYCGIKKIDVQHEGVPLIFGKRLTMFGYKISILEGWIWILPWPFMNIKIVDTREKPKPIPLTEVLSNDNIPMKVDVHAQIKIVDPHAYLSAENPEDALVELSERTVRWKIQEKKAVDLPGAKEELSHTLQDEMDRVALNRWGMDVVQIFVTDIRLPEDLERAMVKKQREEEEATYEFREFQHILKILGAGDEEKGKEAWLKMTPEERAKIMQAERGKRTVVTVDGTAGDFTKGGVAGSVIKGK